jgi:aspartyl-tRNA(Asn)/glutamyl-tRNA(Gln) amidotransferase subunit C
MAFSQIALNERNKTMTCKQDTFKKIAKTAHIHIAADEQVVAQLQNDVQAILDHVEQLRHVDTQGRMPLIHPHPHHQHLRADTMHEDNHIHALADIAPLFGDDLYLVPQVIQTES